MRKTHLLNLFAVLYIIFGVIFSRAVAADAIEVVDVRRNIQLADTDPIYKDFYLNASDSSGLKKNLIVKATRKITVKNQGAKVIGTFKTTVGLLKIIQVEGGVAIARLFELTPREEHPMLEQTGIMIGDQIDMDGSFIDNKKK
ncbi:hypothetical protein [Pseudobdellovibrio sp. HCB154]|uniref:hypothetical protein n=1 Tax=Pseudobdellovibrio sp. HCB154 TaxID=3386277 RepID=UPI003916EB0F